MRTFTLSTALALACAVTAGTARADCQFPNTQAEIRDCVQAGRAKVGDRIAGHLADYAKDPSGGCSNPNLTGAAAGAIGYDEGTRTYGQPDLDEGLFAGGLLLDVADAAQVHGCPSWSETVYRAVIRRYVGSGYAALRERAMLGLTHPAAAASAPALSAPAAAVPSARRKSRP